jgi:O-antigen/teichoic acid export membrane protein
MLAPLAARYLAPREPANAGLYSMYGLIILANLMAESSTGLLQVFNRFRVMGAVMVGQSALTLLLIVGASLLHGGIFEVLIAYLIGKVVWALSITSVAFWQARLHWGEAWWRAPLGLLAERKREIVRFALNTNLTTTLNLVTRDSELLWLSAFSTQVQVGYYKVALAIRNILIMPVEPLISTTYRETAREVAGNVGGTSAICCEADPISAWTLPAAIGLALLGKWLISFYGASVPARLHQPDLAHQDIRTCSSGTATRCFLGMPVSTKFTWCCDPQGCGDPAPGARVGGQRHGRTPQRVLPRHDRCPRLEDLP